MPVKGTHASSDANWISQTTRHGYYGKVDFLFVVQEEADPAYALLRQMQADGRLPKEGLRVLVAGLTKNTSQKLHNMIYAIERVSEASEFVLMLDDDMLLHPGAVAGLAKELAEPTVLAASGSPVTCRRCRRWCVTPLASSGSSWTSASRWEQRTPRGAAAA